MEATPAAAVDEPVDRTVRLEWAHRTDGGSFLRAFCELVQHDREVTLRRGKRLRGVDRYDDEQGETQRFELVRDANRYVEDRIAAFAYEHGATAVRRDATARGAPSDHPALEAECRRAPDDPTPWSVYADWLIAQGNVVGEIASLAARGKDEEAKQLLAAHRDDLFETLGYMPELELRHGFIIGATFARNYNTEVRLDDAVRDFVTSPVARFVEALRFGLAGFESDNDWEPTLRAVCDSPIAPHLRELRFDQFTSDEQEISWVGFGNFAFAWAKLPALERLHIRAGLSGSLGKLVLPKLKTFVRESGGLPAAELAAIAKATWPALEHLEVWFGSRNYGAGGTLAHVKALLARKLPALRHLGIVNCEIENLVPTLAAWPGLRQLHSLDLSKGVLHDRGAAQLVEHARAFRHLASLDLSENLLTEAHVAAITRVLDNVITSDQREWAPYEDDPDEEDHPRYCAIGE